MATVAEKLTPETFTAELEALVAKFGKSMNDNELISALEAQLSRAWEDACKPQPQGLFAAAPALLRTLKDIELDCECDYPPSHGAIKYAARAAIAKAEGR